MKANLSGAIGPAIMVAAKVIPKLLKLTKVLKVGMVGASAASYAYMYSWPFAVCIMVALFIHEWGHTWAMRRHGMEVQGMYFIPFIGAAAIAKDGFPSWRAEAEVAMAGPIIGSLLIIPAVVLYFVTGREVFAGFAGFVAFFNFFNLLPSYPMDGGRLVRSLAFSISGAAGRVVMMLGLVLMISLMVMIKSYVFAFIVFISALGVTLECMPFKYRSGELLTEFHRNRALPKMSMEDRLRAGFSYLTVAAILLWVMLSVGDLGRQMLVDGS